MQTTNVDEQSLQHLGKQTNWFAFIRDPAAAETFNTFMKHQHQDGVCLDPGNLFLLFNWLESGIMPLFVFVDISDMTYPYPELHLLIEKVSSSTHVIVLGNKNDIDHCEKLQKMGIEKYLIMPVTEELLMRSCFELWIKKSSQSQKTKTFIPVIGVRGGVGATTVAINSAYQWSLFPNQRVCLLDLDTQASDMALQLNMSENNSLSEALTSPERVDPLFIKSLLVEKRPNLFVLTNNWSVMHPNQDLQITNDALLHFLMLLYEKVDTIFADLSFPLNTHLMQVLFPHTHCCFLVTHLSLSAVRDTMCLLQWIKTHSPDLDVKIITNLSRPIENLEIISESLEKAIGKKIDLALPYGKLDLQHSVLNGDIFVEQFKKNSFAKKLLLFSHALAQEYQVIPLEQKSFFQKIRDWL